MDLSVLRAPNNIPIKLHEAFINGEFEKAANLLMKRQYFRILDSAESLPVELLDKILLRAAKSRKVELVEKLLNMGARVDAKDRNGATPLHFACKYGPLELVKLLLKHNADVNKQDRWKYTH